MHLLDSSLARLVVHADSGSVSHVPSTWPLVAASANSRPENLLEKQESTNVYYRQKGAAMRERIRLGYLSVIAWSASLFGSAACGADAEFTPIEIQVPDGFVVEVAAAPPLVEFPMMACLDEFGRLFIAESRGQNLDKEGLLEAKHRFIRMLDDTDRDGRFDKSTIFADGLVMPEGAVWYRGSLYVLSSPYLWRFEDADGDGVAEVREKLVGEMEFNGKANQHGAYLGPCGRLYFSGGTFGYDLVGSDGKPAYPVGKATAAGVFSCRLDGSDVEIFATGGINPVEVAFSPEGELFTTCPIIDNTDGRHDALIHWVRGATVGPKDFRPPPLPQTGYRLPPLSRWGQVAPSGLMQYRGDSLGQEYTGRLFATHFNTRTVVTTRLERLGSTFRSFDEDFLASPNPDFHPTDIIEDADGSLLLIDTGGWFRINCPFSKTAKPEIPGAIYRIRRIGTPEIGDARGLALNWKDPSADVLVRRLDDSRPFVRDRAIAALHEMGESAIPALESGSKAGASTRLRRNVIWTASRIGTRQAGGIVNIGLSDPDPSVRQAAIRSAGVLGERRAVSRLREILLDAEEPWPLRRAAATSLGQTGALEAVPAILSSTAQGGDDFFNHAAIYALIEIGDFSATAEGLAFPNPQVQHAALVALDRIDSRRLKPGHVSPLLETDDARLRQAALDLISQRDGWSDQIIGFLRDYIVQQGIDPSQDAMVRGALANYARDERVQTIVARALTSSSTAANVRSVLLEGLARVPVLPERWVEPLRKLLGAEEEPTLVRETVAALSASGTAQLDEPLKAVALNSSHTEDLRAAAWCCLCARHAPLPDSALSLLSERVTCYTILGPLERLQAARAIASARLSEEQVAKVVKMVASVGPIELPALLEALHPSPEQRLSASTASALVAALGQSPGLDSLAAAQLDRVVNGFPEGIRQQARPLAEKLHSANKQRTERLDAIIRQLGYGDVERGRKIFFNNRSACSACHRVAGKGGTIGPDLTKIGSIRKRRDLLESIVFPSATIVNNYETWSAVMTDGRTHSGVIQRATARSVVLRNTSRMELVLNREDVEVFMRQPMSIMPQGLDRVLTSLELSDLLAFLQSLSESAGSP